MHAMILFLYLQQGLDVTLDQANLRGEFLTRADCEAAADKLRGPIPIPSNYSAAWQEALCMPVASNVHVNLMPPLDLGAALARHPPEQCQADGAWQRLAELCRPASRKTP
jgi:hypothetical protein